MAGGLAALLDDVAMIAKMASSAGSKAVGVVVDDAAVTPRYVQGIQPARELPMIWRITKGSLRNKLIFIVPVALLLSQFVPWLLPPLLMLGGCYLCYEGAATIWEYVSGAHKAKPVEPVSLKGKGYEDKMVGSAITTDFILSAEIMVISLNAISDSDFWPRAITLVVVAIGITALVYGVVGLLVKLDDIGLKLMDSDSGFTRSLGSGLVGAMPVVMRILSVVGIVAMLWVGGHILVVGAADLGWHLPLDLVHAVADPLLAVPGVGGFLAWLVDTLISAVLGLLVGAVLVVIVHFLPFGHRDVHAETAPDSPATTT